MARYHYDPYIKACLSQMLPRYGRLDTSHEVPLPPKQADGWFIPHPGMHADLAELGLLGELLFAPCVLEPFSYCPTLRDIQSCLLKQHVLFDSLRFERKAADLSYPMEDWPLLILFFPTAGRAILEDLAPLEAGSSWPKLRAAGSGVYCSSRGFRTLVVVCDRLPKTRETLYVRLLFSKKEEIAQAWLEFQPEWVKTQAGRDFAWMYYNYQRYLASGAEKTLKEEPRMWDVPSIPNYAQERYDELTTALALAELGRNQAEQRERQAEQRERQAELEKRQAELEKRQAIALLITTRFPGINGEQEVLERSLARLPFEQATLRAATWSLPELLRSAAEGER